MQWLMWWKRKREEVEHAIEEADHRLEHVEQGDERVDRLMRRTNRLLAENNLAPAVIRALGTRGARG